MYVRVRLQQREKREKVVEYSMRVKKDTNAPKGPCSAFIFFSNVERVNACLLKSNFGVGEIVKELTRR